MNQGHFHVHAQRSHGSHGSLHHLMEIRNIAVLKKVVDGVIKGVEVIPVFNGKYSLVSVVPEWGMIRGAGSYEIIVQVKVVGLNHRYVIIGKIL